MRLAFKQCGGNTSRLATAEVRRARAACCSQAPHSRFPLETLPRLVEQPAESLCWPALVVCRCVLMLEIYFAACEHSWRIAKV